MKRNKDRFPDDFCFQLNSEEFKALRSQNVTIDNAYGKRKYLDDNHDRYLILDNEECYQLGASLNYAGKKMFSIIKNENREIIDFLLKNADK